MALIPYCEQVGEYLQDAPKTGDMKYWYILMSSKKNLLITGFKNLVHMACKALVF